MKSLLISIFILIAGIAHAQPAYQGGAGGGYAKTNLVLKTGVERPQAVPALPCPLPSGHNIALPPETRARLIDVQGRIVRTSADGVLLTDGLATGVYVLETSACGRIFRQKLILTP